MTAVERCRDCGGLFPFLPRGVCAGCLSRREDAFLRVRAWFRVNPARTVADAARETEVAVELITGWMAEGRIARAEAPDDDAAAVLRADAERRAALRQALVRDGRPPATGDTAEPARPARTGARGMYRREH